MQHNARVGLLALLVIASALLLFTWTAKDVGASPGFLVTTWKNLGFGALLIFIATVLYTRVDHEQKRRVSSTLLSTMIVISIGLGVLTYFPWSTVHAPPPDLTNPTLNPSSGDTSTFFNFTIDYIHSLSLAANVVRVNVSDATNNTYNNFTMIPTEATDVTYFVQAYWPLNGTVVDFANMQAYSSAYANFIQEHSGAARDQFINEKAPTACEEVGSNWSNCGDAFSSNDIYAYANGSSGSPVVQTPWTSNTAVPGSSLTLTKPSGVQSGDLLLILVGNDDSTTTDQWDDNTLKPTGFTLIEEGGSSTPDAHVAAFWRVADGTEGSTINVPAQSSDDYWGFYVRVTGADQVSPIDVVDTTPGETSGTSHAVQSVTTTLDNTLAFYILAFDGGDGDPFSVSGTGWSESDEIGAGSASDNAAGAWGTKEQATDGATGIATVSSSVSDGASHFQFAVAPGAEGNDTAWRDYGYALNASDTVDLVEVGVEAWRIDAGNVTNITVSWDGGSSWAANQTATNRSSDDDTLEWLDFTSATTWDNTKLSDANLRARAISNGSGQRLDYIPVRVTFTTTPTTDEDRNPTACVANGDNWTTCDNAFASDNVYAYSNASSPDQGTSYIIVREATAGDTITTSNFDHDFDTLVEREGDHYTFTPGDSQVLLKAGKYLVLYSSRFDSTGTVRAEMQTLLRLAGTNLSYGWSQCLTRQSGGANECHTSGGAIVDVPSDDQALVLRTFRTDSSAAGTTRTAGWTGMHILRLNSSWSYLRIYRAADKGAPEGFGDVTYDSTDEVDTADFSFTPTSGVITLVTTGHYLVFANTYIQTSGTTRTHYEQRLSLAGSAVEGSMQEVYLRGTDGTNDGAPSIGLLVESTSASQELNVETDLLVGTAGNLIANRTAFSAVKLPNDMEKVRLADLSAQSWNPATLTDFTWDTQREIDTASFTHTAGQSQVYVDKDDDYLFLTSLFSDDTGVTRGVPSLQWSKNDGTTEPYAADSSYSRNSGDSNHAGGWSGLIYSNLTNGDFVEVSALALSTATGTLNADDDSFSGIRLGSIFPSGNDTEWKDFGYSITETVYQVQVGVEWYRTSTKPVLDVTVSWDGGTSWATNQTATNKSADDNTPEYLDFTSATPWDGSKLSDANFRVRAATSSFDGRLDHLTVRVTYGLFSQDILLVQLNTTGIRAGEPDELVVRYNLTNPGDTFNVEVWNGTDWNVRGNLDQTSVSFQNYTLNSDEKISGEVKIRLNDTSDSGVPNLSIQWQLVNSTLWKSGMTYYYNGTLPVGWYDHFFWSNDTDGNSNMTTTYPGPSVTGLSSPVVSNFRLEDMGTQDQRDPTACEAVGENWTNCQDAFTTNDVYAYANGSVTGGDPISFIDATEQSVSGTSLTVNVPTHQDGDTLIAVLVHSDDEPVVTITPPGGWNLVRGKTDMGTRAISPPVLYIYEREASSEPASYVWSWDLTGGLLGVMLSYRGTDASSPIGQNAVNAQTGTGSDAIAPSVTTTNDNELALWIGWSDDDDGNDPSASLGRGTERAKEMTASGGNGAFVGIGDENIPSPGATGTATWTLTAAEERSGVTITLLPAAGVAGNDTAWRDFGYSLNPSDPINKVEVGVEWHRTSSAPVLDVTVSWDGGTSWATNLTATNKSFDDDSVEWLDFTSATAWTDSKLSDANFRVRLGTNTSDGRVDYVTARVHVGNTQSKAGAQIDVDVEHYFVFNVTDDDGWSDIGADGNVSLHLWYDGNGTPELTYSEQTTGANYRIELKYVDTGDPASASLGDWSVTEGRATYSAARSSQTEILSGSTVIGYEFRLALTLGYQVKHAVDPTDSSTGSYNDVDSWNAEVVAYDGVNTVTYQEASTGEHMEFGVFMYTFVSISADWTVSLSPGQTTSTNTVTVYRRSNDDFTMTIWFTTHLVKGSDTLSITNVQILAAADPGDNITADLAFAGLGEGNARFIYGTASWYFTHSTDTDEDTVSVQFSVTAATPVAAGVYTAQLTIRLVQKPA